MTQVPVPVHSVFDIEPDAPLILSCGLGIDSIAMIIALVERGVPITAILFADTGGEKPETLAYLPIINKWLRSHNQPQVDVVRYRQKHGRYDTLAGNCLANSMLPSLAYGGRGCSHKFKSEVMDAHVLGARRGLWKGDGMPAAAEARRRGLPIYRAIGYDAGPKDSRRPGIPDDAHFRYVYPLREFSLDRIGCIRTIIAAGLPVPIKSACYFCPASKPAELIWLHAVHPDLFLQALLMEEKARPKLQKVEGLWRKSTRTKPGSWVEWAIAEGMAERRGDGSIGLIEHRGPPPPHPDELVVAEVARQMAA